MRLSLVEYVVLTTRMLALILSGNLSTQHKYTQDNIDIMYEIKNK